MASHALPQESCFKLRPIRSYSVTDRYGGLIPSGWDHWLFEWYEFPFEVVYPQTLDAGNVNSRFDVLVFPDDAFHRSDEERARFRYEPAARCGGRS